MSAPHTTEGSPAQQALARATLLDALSLGFRYPDAELYAQLQNGEFLRTLHRQWETLGLPRSDCLERLRAALVATLASGQDVLESDYIATFEAHPSQSPVRPYAHRFRSAEAQLALLARLERCYRAQGVTLTRGADAEQQDHLCVQLDFLALLYQRLASALAADETSVAEALAQSSADFHCELDWVTDLHAALTHPQRQPFYAALAEALTIALAALPRV